MIEAPDLSKIRACTTVKCPIRDLCEMPKGKLEPKEYIPEFTKKDGCDFYWPVADLRGENLRDNPSNQYQFDARTKRHRKRGGEWK